MQHKVNVKKEKKEAIPDSIRIINLNEFTSKLSKLVLI